MALKNRNKCIIRKIMNIQADKASILSLEDKLKAHTKEVEREAVIRRVGVVQAHIKIPIQIIVSRILTTVNILTLKDLTNTRKVLQFMEALREEVVSKETRILFHHSFLVIQIILDE